MGAPWWSALKMSFCNCSLRFVCIGLCLTDIPRSARHMWRVWISGARLKGPCKFGKKRGPSILAPDVGRSINCVFEIFLLVYFYWTVDFSFALCAAFLLWLWHWHWKLALVQSKSGYVFICGSALEIWRSIIEVFVYNWTVFIRFKFWLKYKLAEKLNEWTE